MRREFRLPDLGSGLQEGEIVAWHVAVGQTAHTDEILCEIETEKALVEIPVPFDGTIVALGAEEGRSIEVGSVLVVIEDGDGPAAEPDEEPAADREPAPGPEPVPEPEPTREPEPSAGRPPVRPLAMPLVRKLAREHGIDLTTVAGTGTGGRITRRDVERAIEASRPQPAPEGSTVRLSGLRRAIATHMAESWREIPHVFSSIEVDAGALLAARRTLADRHGARVPLEALVMLAVLPLLRDHPEFNATLEGDHLILHRRYDLGFAVDTPDGLIVPVVSGADRLSVAELSGRIDDLAARTRDRKVRPEELTGATFTVNNIGALGRATGTSIIPKGTTAILSFARARDLPTVKDGSVVVSPVMPVNLAFDHRVIDGGGASTFLEQLAGLLEDPIGFLAP